MTTTAADLAARIKTLAAEFKTPLPSCDGFEPSDPQHPARQRMTKIGVYGRLCRQLKALDPDFVVA